MFASCQKYINVNTILVSTFTPHNYSRSDVGKVVTLYNTTTTPSLDDTHILYNVFEETSFVIPGSIPSGGFSPPGGFTRTPGLDGSIASYNPFSTHIVFITNIVLNVSTTTFTCIDHKLQVGDTIKFFNLYSTPTINDMSFAVFAVPNANTIIINYIPQLDNLKKEDIHFYYAFLKNYRNNVFPY